MTTLSIDRLAVYDSFLPEFFEVLKTQEPNQELLTMMTGKVIEYQMNTLFKAKAKNTKGSDSLVLESQTFTTTRNNILRLNINDRLEIKGTTGIHTGSKMRVNKVLGKRDQCEFIIIKDARPEVNRVFCIPHDEFFDRCEFRDLSYTQNITWDEDYIPTYGYGNNTELLLDWEIDHGW
jgi:hypothetical protein